MSEPDAFRGAMQGDDAAHDLLSVAGLLPRGCLLVVEDDGETRRLMATLLSSAGVSAGVSRASFASASLSSAPSPLCLFSTSAASASTAHSPPSLSSAVLSQSVATLYPRAALAAPPSRTLPTAGPSFGPSYSGSVRVCFTSAPPDAVEQAAHLLAKRI